LKFSYCLFLISLFFVSFFLGAAIAVSLARSAHALDDSYTLTLARTQLAVYSPAAVKDSLEAALGTANVTVESLRSGVELTLKQLNSVFEKFRVVEINPVGQKFDPHRHQAINTVESEAEPNTVVQVFQKGYLLNERVIRPAMVAVAKAKAGAD